MAKKVEIEVDVKGNILESTKNVRALKQQLKEVPAGTAEWSKIKNQIRDIEDALQSAEQSSEDFKGMLENAPGPLGALGGAIKKVELATKSFGAAFKAIGIGLLVSLIGGLVAAFSQTEGSMKKLEPLFIGLEKILGGILEVFQPLLDAFLELALQALPYITKGIGMFYSSLLSLFTLIKELGVGAGKILKGIFTLDWDSISSGYEQITGSWDKTVKSFNTNMDRYEAGTKKLTKTEKENQKERSDAADKALQEKLKRMDTEDKLDEAKLEKMKAEAMALAVTEQQKLDVEKAFAQKSYDLKLKDLQDKQKLYQKGTNEYKEYEAQILKLQADFKNQQTQFTEKQKGIDEAKRKETFDSELQDLESRKVNGQIKEKEYQEALFELRKKYAKDDKELKDAQLAYDKYLAEEKKKQEDLQRQQAFQSIQDQIDNLDKLNQKREDDFRADIARLEEKKKLLEQQRDLELAAVEGDEQKKLEIRQKYAKQIGDVETQITNTQKAEQEARTALQLQYADLVGQFGNFLQSVAGKNKGLAKAGLIIEQAAGVAKIIINTQANAAKAGYLSPKGIAELVAGGIGVAAAVAATVKGIRQIDAQSAEGGSGGGGGQNLGRNYAEGGMINGPRHAQGGVMINAEGGEAIMTRGAVTMFKPLLSALNQAGGGTSFNSSIVTRPDNPALSNPAASKEPMIMKTYVVESELTNEQQKQARLKDLSTL